jgi:hypothetical protein
VKRTTLALTSLCIVAVFAGHALAVVNGQPPASNDYRYDAIASFGLTERLTKCTSATSGECEETPCENLPFQAGAGCDCLNTFGNGTWVGGCAIVMAKHTGLMGMPCGESCNNGDSECIGSDTADYTFRFRRRPNGTLASPTDCSTYTHIRPLSFTTIEGCPDIAIAIISCQDDAFLASFIAPIPFDEALPVEVDDTVTIAGWGSTDNDQHSPDMPGDVLICENIVTNVYCDSFTFQNEDPEGCHVAYYDSGGPILLEVEGDALRLVGVIFSHSAAVYARVHLDPEYQPSSCCLCAMPTTYCHDFNNDGDVSYADLQILIGQWGQCADCQDCPFDLDDDCYVGIYDVHIVISQFACDCTDCPDFNNSTIVDVSDLLAVIANWGECECTYCLHDVVQDGQVGVADLFYVINHWGPCDDPEPMPEEVSDCMDDCSSIYSFGSPAWTTCVNDSIDDLCKNNIIDCE